MLSEYETKILNRCFGVIYVVVNKHNGMLYVGQTVKKGCRYGRYWGGGLLITRSVENWKAQGHCPEEKYCKNIIKECKDLEDLNYWETKIIRDWNCVEREDCYNIVEGGGGYKRGKGCFAGFTFDEIYGKERSKEIRQQISDTVTQLHKEGKLHGWEIINDSPLKDFYIQKALNTRLKNGTNQQAFFKAWETKRENGWVNPIKGVSKKDLMTEEEYLQMIDKRNATINERYSKGELQRRAVAQRLINDPEGKSYIKQGETMKRLLAEGLIVNPMLGKHHTDATKFKISELRKELFASGKLQRTEEHTERVRLILYKKSIVSLIANIDSFEKYPEDYVFKTKWTDEIKTQTINLVLKDLKTFYEIQKITGKNSNRIKQFILYELRKGSLTKESLLESLEIAEKRYEVLTGERMQNYDYKLKPVKKKNKKLEISHFRNSIKKVIKESENYLPKYEFRSEWTKEEKLEIVKLFVCQNKSIRKISDKVDKSGSSIKNFLINVVKDNPIIKKQLLKNLEGKLEDEIEVFYNVDELVLPVVLKKTYKRTDEHNRKLKVIQFKKSVKNIIDKSENYLSKYGFYSEWESEVKEQIINMFIDDGKNMVEIHKTVHKNPEYIKRFLINEVKDNLETKKRFLEKL